MRGDFLGFAREIVQDVQVQFELVVDSIPVRHDGIGVGAQPHDAPRRKVAQRPQRVRDVSVGGLAVARNHHAHLFARGEFGDDGADRSAQRRATRRRRRHHRRDLPHLLALRRSVADAHDLGPVVGRVQKTELRRCVEFDRHFRDPRQRVAELVPATGRHELRNAARRQEPVSVSLRHGTGVVHDVVARGEGFRRDDQLLRDTRRHVHRSLHRRQQLLPRILRRRRRHRRVNHDRRRRDRLLHRGVSALPR
mmetsp:Transcript_2525/g.7508  ORF Transcript_2525/g.7508 Transcript_2525/m.7508 type:complete len:251 (+) Transcript_2525:1002-1754(+)